MPDGGCALSGLHRFQLHVVQVVGPVSIAPPGRICAANKNAGWRLRLIRPTSLSATRCSSRRPGKHSATGQNPRRRYKMPDGGCALSGLHRFQLHVVQVVGPVSIAPPGRICAANKNAGWRLRLIRPTSLSATRCSSRRPGKHRATGQNLAANKKAG